MVCVSSHCSSSITIIIMLWSAWMAALISVRQGR